MVQIIGGAIVDNLSSTNAYSHIEDALIDMTDQLNNSSLTSETYTDFATSYTVQTAPGSYSLNEEVDYIRDALQELYNQNIAFDGDCFIIPDGQERWGYGLGNISYSPSGSSTRIYGGRVLHTPSQNFTADPPVVFKNMCMHEAAHCFDAEHYHGEFETQYGINRDASPMITCYGQDTSGRPDTCVEGGDTPPYDIEMECGSNYVGNSWYGTCSDSQRHSTTMSTCTIRQIDIAAPL